jgi:hypothetical protein
LTTFIVPGLLAGEQYYLRYRARNTHGWSDDYSPIVPILMASKPDQPLSVTTTNSGVSVIITWDVPASDGSAEITAYRVKF